MLACCYRSPTPSESSNQNNEKLIRLFRCIKKKNYSHWCIVGDFNFKNINENSTETSFIEAVRDSNLYQHVEETTRRRGNDDLSLLDPIFTNEAMQVSDIQHHSPLGKSEHSVVSFKVHCYLDFTKAKESYAYAKGDYVSMRNELENSTSYWLRTYTALDEQTSIGDKRLSLKSMLIKQKENFVPKQSTSGKPSWKNKGCFPINKRTQEAIKNKNKTYRAWMRSTVLIDSESSRLEYTKARNKVSAMVRRVKREFEKGIAAQAKINPKKRWSQTRRNLKTKSTILKT